MSPSRQGRWLRRLVVTLVLVAILAFVVDKVAGVVAQNQLASMAQKEAAKYGVRSADTSVKINGFFIPQLIKQDFSKVNLTMGKPTFDKVPGENLTVDMNNVHVPRSLLFQQSGTVTVGTTDMQVRMSPREVGRLAVRSTGLAGLTTEVVNGKLHAKLAMQGINIDVPVVPQVQQGRIALALEESATGAPSALQDRLKNLLARGISLPELPFGAQLTSVNVQDNAVVLAATVKDLKFTR
ncbi:LmeA family phospholipid-binding protein [Kribbella solani]|uniref:DUF2993 domain-containing protein n=1 Tax=Kribbella solani TaxID=236067 RepID=A0A841DVV0_9ACTN|nr:DUF2993 domain-containing protein [Kribbella solani]MBB5983254.1 hypothetical protein [Kribbella solani]